MPCYVRALELAIVAADTQWQQQTLRAAITSLDDTKTPKQPAGPGAPDAKRDALKTLRYLGTPLAAHELAKRLGDGDTTGDLAFGLIGSPSHDAALREMQRMLADPDFGLRGAVRHKEVIRVDLEQGQHPRLIGRYDLGRQPFFLPNDGDDDERRLVGEVERAGNDVAVRRDDQAGRRADAFA